MRKIFSVYIEEKSYDVYDIDGKEHDGLNDICKTWWLYYTSTDLAGATPPPDSEYFRPFDKGIERHVWDVHIKQANVTKEKWNRTNFRSSIVVTISCNGRPFYEFHAGGTYLDYAMAKVQYVIVQMSEHPFNFFEPEKENGRKICWYGLPATVRVSQSRPWEISIVPEYTDLLPQSAWWEELARREHKYTAPDENFDEMDADFKTDDLQRGYIHWGEALSDQHIYWFRK